MSDTMTDKIRHKLSEFKYNLKTSGVDVAATFASVDAAVEKQIEAIEAEVAAGQSPIPVHDYADVAAGRIDEAATARIKQRGVVILHNTFDAGLVTGWNDWLMDYVVKNNFFERQKEKKGWTNIFPACPHLVRKLSASTGQSRRWRRAPRRNLPRRAAG